MSSYSHRAWYYESAQDHFVSDPISQQRPSNLHNAFPVRSLYIHEFIFLASLILSKYTSSLCLGPILHDWKTDFPSQPIHCSHLQFMYLTCLRSPFPPSLILLNSNWVRVFYISCLCFPYEPDIMKIHKETLFMTRFSNIERQNSFNNLDHDRISRLCALRLWAHFSTGANIMGIHTVTVFMIQYSKLRDRAILATYATQFQVRVRCVYETILPTDPYIVKGNNAILFMSVGNARLPWIL